MNEPQSTPSTTSVLILVSSPGNRRVLIEWVRSAGDYTLAGSSADNALADGSLPAFDVSLVDRPGLEQFAPALRESKASQPAFLPCLLIEKRGAEFESLDPSFRELVDDVLSSPINPAQLSFRVQTLARRRVLSMDLLQSEERYRRLFELAPNAKFLLDDGVIKATNRAAEQFLGDSGDDRSGESLDSFVADEDRSALADLLGTAPTEITSRGPTFHTLTFDLDDRTAICEVAAARTGEGEELLVVLLDITERIERERQLELYRRAMDEAAIGITITDPNLPGNPLIYVNDQFVEISGYSREEALGRNCRFLQGDQTDRQAIARISRAIDEERPVSETLVNYRKNGELFYNGLDVMPVHDTSGTVTHYLGFQRDVTDRVRSRRRLSVLDRVLRHNVRNRMNVVTGYAEQLLQHSDPAVRSAADRILLAGEGLLQQSETARYFRNTVTGDDIEMRPRNLAADVREAIEEIRSGYPNSEIVTSIPDKAMIRGDDGVKLAIVELTENAAEHGAPPIVVSIDVGPDETVLTVSDSGDGIPKSEQAVFDDSDEQPTRHAAGVGLWLVRWTVERVGGYITYYDQESTAVKLHFVSAAEPPDAVAAEQP